jgi:hypothetical protein
MQPIFVNLPVGNLQVSRDFYAALGFTFNEQFSDNHAACVVVSDSIFVMLLVKDYFASFIDKPIADAKQQTEVLLCLSSPSRAAADTMVASAVQAGGSAPRPPKDYGFMYQQGFEDPDGHLWELACMLGEPPKH